MTRLAAAILAALCLFAHTAFAGIVEQYEAASEAWNALHSGSQDPCGMAHSYDEMMSDIDLALVKGQLVLVQPRMRYLDLGEQDRRDLRAFYGRLEQARGEAARRCRR